MNLSFREASLWITLVSVLAVFAFYFFNAFPLLSAAEAGDRPLFGLQVGLFGLLALAVLLIVVIEVVLHVVVAIVYALRQRHDLDTQEDERDKLIGLKATRNGHVLLVLGVWAAFMGAWLSPTPLLWAHTLLLAFVCSEVVRIATQLIHYRRGV